MLLAAVCFVLLDGTGKYLVRDFPLAQVVWIRYVSMTLLVTAALTWMQRWRHARTRRPGTHFARGLLLILTTGSVFAASRVLPLSQVYSISYLSPFLVAILAALFLGERVSPIMWLLIGVGFLGALVIIQPELGTDVAPVTATGIFWSLMTAVGIAGYQTMTRLLGSTEHPWTQILYASLVGVTLTAPFGLSAWQAPPLPAAVLMGLMGVFGFLAQLFLVHAFTVGEAAMLAPFNYTTLIWASLFDGVVFGKLPGATTFLGALIIVGSGLAILGIRWRRRPVKPAVPTGPRP